MFNIKVLQAAYTLRAFSSTIGTNQPSINWRVREETGWAWEGGGGGEREREIGESETNIFMNNSSWIIYLFQKVFWTLAN